MALDLTNFNTLGTDISKFLSADIQFSEDITTMLSSISKVETEFMTSYSEGLSSDRSVIDKIFYITENWRKLLKELYTRNPKQIIQSNFSFTEGVSKSNDQPYLFYDSSTKSITLNVSSFSNDIIIYSTPLMRWEDGSKVILETKWYGIGSKKTTCIIEDSGHFDEQVKGTVYFKRANLLEPVKTTTKFDLYTDTNITDQPYVTFNSVTNKLTLNFNVMKDTPHINQIPELLWIGDTINDTQSVQLITDWTGLGTYSASCIIDVESIGPLTETIQGTVILTYESGSSEAWSLQYDWDYYDSLVTTIEAALDLSAPLTINNYVTFADAINGALSDCISLEAQLIKDYSIASTNDLPVIQNVLVSIRNWKEVLRDTLINLNAIFSVIKT